MDFGFAWAGACARSSRRWTGLALSIVALVVAQLAVGPAGRGISDPWPAMLSGDMDHGNADFAALQKRADAALARLYQAADVTDARQH